MKLHYKQPNPDPANIIPYTIDGNQITFNDDMTLNLSRYERDSSVHIDICIDRDGNAAMGVVPGLAEYYAAQIDIPERQYNVVPGEPDEDGSPTEVREAVPFDMDGCSLTLWDVGGRFVE